MSLILVQSETRMRLYITEQYFNLTDRIALALSRTVFQFAQYWLNYDL